MSTNEPKNTAHSSKNAEFADRMLHGIEIAGEAVDGFKLNAGVRDVLVERQRQISVEGWTPAHDDEHKESEMALAAAGYAAKACDQIQCVALGLDDSTLNDDIGHPGSYPWPYAWEFKPCPPRRALVKAGALILAEIERLDRLEAAKNAEG